MTNKNYSVKSENKFDTDVSVLASYAYGYGYDYVRINADVDSKNGKITDISYCSVINPSDSSSRWINRNSAISNVGEDAIIAGEKLLAKNVHHLRKMVRDGKSHPAFEAMNVEFEKTVKNYKTDFTWHDMIQLAIHPNQKFVWCTRDCGTELYFGVNEWMKVCLESGDRTRVWFVWSIQTGLIQIMSGDILDIAIKWFED